MSGVIGKELFFSLEVKPDLVEDCVAAEQIVDAKVEGKQFFAVLFDVVALVEDNYRVFKVDSNLLPEISIKYVIIRKNSQVTLHNSAPHQVIRTKRINFPNLCKVWNTQRLVTRYLRSNEISHIFLLLQSLIKASFINIFIIWILLEPVEKGTTCFYNCYICVLDVFGLSLL